MPVATREPPQAVPADAEAPDRSYFVPAAALLVALVAGAAGWLLATDDDDSGNAGARAERPRVAMPAMGSGAMPAAMHRDRDTAARAPARTGPRRVRVELGEMYVRPSVRSIGAGKVTFVVRNVGKLEHELIVSRIPVVMEAPGMPDHHAGLGMTDHMGPGGKGKLTLRMKPGTYELFCNVPGHYAAGQRLRFKVRSS